ncbi:hypothetical protein N658DRAFT_500443 [Parathielavia hyrcaniae]|uniref:Uncharacterized protein n=1 Tax=Parathielavia hyrcaniae TaxID=113614 RepID=A0AAN6SYC6_9PEZI|nr:hypothetical protein N658DRAFT_500443 [Parathielavia hyrcaniae]
MHTSGIRHAYVMQASAPGPSLKAWSHAHPVMVILALFVQYYLYVQADQTVCVVPVTFGMSMWDSSGPTFPLS